MSIRLDQVVRAEKTRTPEELGQLFREHSQPVNLFATSEYVSVSNVTHVGVSDDLGVRLQETQERFRQIEFSDPSKQVELNTAVNTLSTAILNELPTYLPGETRLSGATTAAADEAVEVYITGSGKANRDEAENAIMGAALFGFEQDIMRFAEDLKRKIDTKDEVKVQQTELDTMLQDWPEVPADATEEFTYMQVTENEDGSITTLEVTENLTREEAEQLSTELGHVIDRLTSQTELQQYDLQDLYSGWQRSYQMLSEILKNMHDTQKAMIQNTRS
ncbi:MAG: hypothetical protein AAF654_08435 [Myxococcota bacterium]